MDISGEIQFCMMYPTILLSDQMLEYYSVIVWECCYNLFAVLSSRFSFPFCCYFSTLPCCRYLFPSWRLNLCPEFRGVFWLS